MKNKLKLLKTGKPTALFFASCLIASFVLASFTQVSALTDIQKKIFDVDVQQYDKEKIKANTGGGSSESGGNLSGGCSQEQIWNYLIGKQVQGTALTPQHVAGIMGNMHTESGFYSNRLQGRSPENGSDVASDAGGGGYGLVQWTPGSKIIPEFNRLKDTFNPPATKHSDMRFQLQLLVDQLNGVGGLAEAAAGRRLVGAGSVPAAVEAFMLGFERPADQSQSAINSRVPAAEDAFNRGSSGQWDCPSSGGGGSS
jgi:hypothetical protein